MKKYAERFYKSGNWLKCRDAFFKYKNGICERCGEAGKIVHHKVRLTPKNINDPGITLSFRNLELLCQKCHTEEHEEDIKRGRRENKAKPQRHSRYRIDENGDILPPGQ